MKKGLFFAALALVVVMLGSCTRFKPAHVSVLVKDAGGNAIESIRVGMFNGDVTINSAEFEKAILKDVTDVTGKAEFEVTTVEFALEKKGIFNFIVFDSDLKPLAESGVKSIKTGSSTVVEIAIP
jgi:hypothetical protein